MSTFKGFDRDALLMLAENKFNDSKTYYDSIKETLKQKAIVPMRQICSDLAPLLFEIDEQMNLIPVKMVSRIRRDTRRAKNMDMYRDNIWCMFMRHKYEWNYQPCMWFEIVPGCYTIGVGMYHTDSRFLEKYREVFSENQNEFEKALRTVLSAGADPSIERYAKDKPGTVKSEFSDYYNAKNLYFIKSSFDLEPLFDGTVLDELKSTVTAYAPMYKFFLKATEKMISEKGR